MMRHASFTLKLVMTGSKDTSPVPPTALVWIDLEMTGLELGTNKILEVAILVTSLELEPLDSGFSAVVSATEEELEQMDSWNRDHHGRSGLSAEALESGHTIAEVERQAVHYLKSNDLFRGASPMCGRSNFLDRRFLERDAPELLTYFSYRSIDVATVSQLALMWAPVFEYSGRSSKHRAMDDIKLAIEELRHYRAAVVDRYHRRLNRPSTQ